MNGFHALAVTLLLAQLSPEPTVPLRQGGLCAGRVWIELKPDETVREVRGPDATEYTIAGDGHEVRVLDSFNPVEIEHLGTDIREINGGRLYLEPFGNGQPKRYTIANPEHCQQQELCSRFVWLTTLFDKRFDGTEADRNWLKRIQFGDAAQAICKWKP